MVLDLNFALALIQFAHSLAIARCVNSLRNLISNSVEAFIRLRENRDRVITVCVEQNEKSIVFTYRDSGPGLSDEIVNPTDIFKPLFTTKRSTSTGEEIGTGLGMWLVKLISEDNDARVILLTPREGFGVQIIFPIKYKR